MSELNDYAVPVRHSIMARDLIMGISAPAFYIIAGVSWVVMYNLQKPVFLLISVVLYFLIRILMKRDVYIVEILIETLMQPDVLYV